jgi:hypothetical protein
MNHSKLLMASALAAAAWCTAPQAQTILYGVDLYSPSSTGATPSLENTSVYPKHPGNAGYVTSEYWDNGVLWQRSDPLVVDSSGAVTYVYPETARFVAPAPTVIYSTPPSSTYYPVPTYDLRIE